MATEQAQFAAELAQVKKDEDPDAEAKLIAADLKQLDATAPVATASKLKEVVPVTHEVTPIAIKPATTKAPVVTPIPVRENGLATAINNQLNGGVPITGTSAGGPAAVKPIAISPSGTPGSTPTSVAPVATTPISTSPVATTPISTTPVAVTPLKTTPTTTAATPPAKKLNWFEQLLVSMLNGVSNSLENWAHDLNGAPAATTPVALAPVAPITAAPIALPAGVQPLPITHIATTINSAQAIDARLAVKYPLPIQRQIIRTGIVNTVRTGWSPSTVQPIAIRPTTLSGTNTAFGD